MAKLSEAQYRANKKYEHNNPERTSYISYRSKAKTFITKKVTNNNEGINDLLDLKKLIEEKLKEFKKE